MLHVGKMLMCSIEVSSHNVKDWLLLYNATMNPPSDVIMAMLYVAGEEGLYTTIKYQKPLYIMQVLPYNEGFLNFLATHTM